jgi:uncharacterized protein (TIGR02444 family)
VEFPASPFWNFSLALYGAEGVAPACLRLQERHGVDVNFLFFCIWRGVTRGPITEQEIAAKHAAVAEWHQAVVRHLRALRRRLKSPIEPVDPDLAQALRARIQKIEIDAEHIEQLTLAAGTLDANKSDPPSDADARDHALANLSAYFALICAGPDADDRRDIDLLVETALSVR